MRKKVLIVCCVLATCALVITSVARAQEEEKAKPKKEAFGAPIRLMGVRKL